MKFLGFLKSAPDDIENLKNTGDIPSLIHLMGNSNPTTRWQAAEALGKTGTAGVPLLVSALMSAQGQIRLGAVEALGALQDPRALHPLVDLFSRERNIEVKWAIVLALGEIGSPEAVPHLIPLLKHENKYLRYGAACSLNALGWVPSGENDRLSYLIALQDWKSVKQYGPVAVAPLSAIFGEADPSTRTSIISLLGEIGDPAAHTTCQAGLRDLNARVRWTAVLAAMNCGIRSIHLPPFVADRKRSGPDPAAAALLNFLFLGIGYNYMGKWWGFPVFMAYMSVLVLAQLYTGPFLPYLVAYPVTAVLGVHTYYMTKRMSDL